MDSFRNPDSESLDSPSHYGPPMATSRGSQNKMPPALRRKRLQRRAAWRCKRLQVHTSDVIDGGSSDDEDKHIHAIAFLEQYSRKTHANRRPSADENAQARRNLKYLPRPSDAVPSDQFDECPRANAPVKGTTAHHRRIIATALRIENLDKYGKSLAVYQWRLMDEGLKGYTQFLGPPESDRNLKKLSVPRHLLTRSYRGGLLKVSTHGTKGNDWGNLNSEGQHGTDICNGMEYESQHLSAMDDEYWATTSEFSDEIETATQKENGPLHPSGKNANRSSHHLNGTLNGTVPKGAKEVEVDQVNISKLSSDQSTGVLGDAPNENELSKETPEDDERIDIEAWTKSVLEKIKDDEDSSSLASGDSDSSSAKTPNVGNDEKETEELASESPEPDHWDSLLKRVQENNDPFPGEEDTKKPHAKRSSNVNATVNKENDHGSVEKSKSLTRWEQEKHNAAVFCSSRSDFSKQQNFAILGRGGIETRALQGKGDNRTLEQRAPYASRVMKKMGFTGRLGAREQGTAQPVVARKNPGRSGIGAHDRSVVIEVDKNGDEVELIDDNSCSNEVTAETSSLTKMRPKKRQKRRQNCEITNATATITLRSNGISEAVKSLDEDDEYETGADEGGPDNTRRGIVVDADVVIANSDQRRLNAFRSMASKSKHVRSDYNVDAYFLKETRKLSHSDHVRGILNDMGEQAASEKEAEMLQLLDEAFLEGYRPEYNFSALRVLKAIERHMYVGLLHRGSQRMLKKDFEPLGLDNSFSGGPCIAVGADDKWPYSRSWKELLSRVGVRPNQSLFWVRERTGDGKIDGGLLACTLLDARWMRMRKDSLTLEVMGLDEEKDVKEILVEDLISKRDVFIDNLLKSRKRQRRKRRVLALRPSDGAWYSGLEEIDGTEGLTGNSEGSLIRFHGTDDMEWIELENVTGLVRKHFRTMCAKGFPGLLDPDDVETL